MIPYTFCIFAPFFLFLPFFPSLFLSFSFPLSSLCLSPYLPVRSHQIKVFLKDPNAKESDLGYILVQLEVNSQSHHEKVDRVKEVHHCLRHASHQFWKSTVSITLLGAKGLPAMDHNGIVY